MMNTTYNFVFMNNTATVIQKLTYNSNYTWKIEIFCKIICNNFLFLQIWKFYIGGAETGNILGDIIQNITDCWFWQPDVKLISGRFKEIMSDVEIIHEDTQALPLATFLQTKYEISLRNLRSHQMRESPALVGILS